MNKPIRTVTPLRYRAVNYALAAGVVAIIYAIFFGVPL